MKRMLLIIIAVLIAFSAISCKGRKEAAKLPDEQTKAQIPAYAPLPSFKEVFRALGEVPAKDYSAMIPQKLFKTKQEGPRNAFALGVLTADAVLVAKARNKARLTEISQEMMNLTALLNLEDEINRMGANLKTLIEQEKWDELDASLDSVKKSVEDKLWELENYEYYTLMILGGWTEALGNVSRLLAQNYKPETTKAINQKGTWNSLAGNIELIATPAIKDSESFKAALPLVQKVRDIINTDSANTYSQDQLKELIASTDQIKAAYQK